MAFDPKAVKAVLFDLDGTLIDSTADLAASANHLRFSQGLGPLDLPKVASFIGDGVEALVRRVLDRPEGGIEAEVTAFKRHYTEHCLDQTRFYDGVKPVVEALHAKGLRLAVVTNKPEQVSRRILDGLGVGPCFGSVVGGNSCANKKPHPEPLLKALSDLGASPAQGLMVGDSRVDIEAGRNAGLPVIGILGGIGDEALLRASAPDLILERFAGLKELL